MTFVQPDDAAAARSLLQELVADPQFAQLVQYVTQKNELYRDLEVRYNNGKHISSALLRLAAEELVHENGAAFQSIVAQSASKDPAQARQRLSFAASMASDRI